MADLRHALADAFPTENIRVEGRGDEVALAGTVPSADTGDAAVKLAGLFSKNVANSLLINIPHTPQVRLKVRIVEIDRSTRQQLGFNFFGPGKNSFYTSTGQFGGVTVGPNLPTTDSPIPKGSAEPFLLCCPSSICSTCSTLQPGSGSAPPSRRWSTSRSSRSWPSLP